MSPKEVIVFYVVIFLSFPILSGNGGRGILILLLQDSFELRDEREGVEESKVELAENRLIFLSFLLFSPLIQRNHSILMKFQLVIGLQSELKQLNGLHT